MRINTINRNYSFENGGYYAGAGINRKSGASGRNVSFGLAKKLTNSDYEAITRLIKDSDESRLDETVQELYKYGDFMVKSPDEISKSDSIKEFYALRRLKGKNSPVPEPVSISNAGSRNFLVEDFIQGDHLDSKPFSLKKASDMVKNIEYMDEKGIVNLDLSPRNIMVQPDGAQKIIDFDDFTFISEQGKTLYSKTTPTEYFVPRLPKSKLGDAGYSIAWAKKAGKDVSSSEMFANSFKQSRKAYYNPKNTRFVKNMSENPYINAPSGLSSYETKTIYKKILNDEVDEPVEFLKNYVYAKSKNYHPKMRDFLKGLKITDETLPNGISTDKAKKALENAIEYEDFLSNLFNEKKPDAYFAKLEAAKIQLHALMDSENLNRYVTNEEQVQNAYEKVIKLLSDGLESYKEPKYQKYLDTELELYKDAFKTTNFSTTKPKQSVLGYLDIVGRKFSDPCTDKNTFYNLSVKAKETGAKTLYDLRQSADKSKVCTAITGEERAVIKQVVNEQMSPVGKRVSKSDLESGIESLINEISDEAQAGKFGSIRVKIPKKNLKKDADRVIKNVSKQAKDLNSAAQDSEKIVQKHLEDSLNSDYLKRGSAIFKGMGVVLAGGLVILYKYLSSKKETEAKTEIVYNPGARDKKLPINGQIRDNENSPFKEFII